MSSLRFDVFGRQVLVTATGDDWAVYYVGSEGKRRPARDIVVPSEIPESGIAQYLDDLCHEWATPRRPVVKRLR